MSFVYLLIDLIIFWVKILLTYLWWWFQACLMTKCFFSLCIALSFEDQMVFLLDMTNYFSFWFNLFILRNYILFFILINLFILNNLRYNYLLSANLLCALFIYNIFLFFFLFIIDIYFFGLNVIILQSWRNNCVLRRKWSTAFFFNNFI